MMIRKLLNFFDKIYPKPSISISGHFKLKETNFRMSNLIINNLTSTNQTKLLFNSKYLSRLWLYGSSYYVGQDSTQISCRLVNLIIIQCSICANLCPKNQNLCLKGSGPRTIGASLTSSWHILFGNSIFLISHFVCHNLFPK